MLNKKKKKILIVMPKFPYPATGACEQDRMTGLEIFGKFGYEIKVIAKTIKGRMEDAKKIGQDMGIEVFPVSYKFKRDIKRFFNPLYWDGASYEYRDEEIVDVLNKQLNSFKPDVVWFEYTYLWPLYSIARKQNIPIVTRSINFEPTHFLEEDGYSFFNILKFPFKFISEILTASRSDFLFSITPKEEKTYRRLGVKNIANLPLRGLCKYIGKGPEILQIGRAHV